MDTIKETSALFARLASGEAERVFREYVITDHEIKVTFRMRSISEDRLLLALVELIHHAESRRGPKSPALQKSLQQGFKACVKKCKTIANENEIQRKKRETVTMTLRMILLRVETGRHAFAESFPPWVQEILVEKILSVMNEDLRLYRAGKEKYGESYYPLVLKFSAHSQAIQSPEKREKFCRQLEALLEIRRETPYSGDMFLRDMVFINRRARSY